MVLSACGYGTHYINLSYPPEKQSEIAPRQVTPSAGDSHGPAVLLTVNDKRDIVNRIGIVLNDLGPNASVLTEHNIAVWVHDAVAYELQNLGYEVSARDSASLGESTATLTVAILNINCIIAGFYESKVLLQATLDQEGGPSYEGEFSGKGSAGMNLMMSDEKAAESLARALQQSIQTMLHDFGYLNRVGENRGRTEIYAHRISCRKSVNNSASIYHRIAGALAAQFA